jgi:hypothetical protein
VKIVFFCPSLEPGRDGVGDYTRRLASECARLGHDCRAIALHDPHVTTETQTLEGDIRLVRFPAEKSWGSRIARAFTLVSIAQPDWVSWQFVAYGFHPKGFVPLPLRHLSTRFLSKPRCHVMLHELWIGLETTSNLRSRIVGWEQRREVLGWLRKLRPGALHTSNPTYQAELARRGLTAGVLGLFGNMPIVTEPAPEGLGLERFLPGAVGANRSGWLIATTFGTLHPQWQPEATVSWLIATAQRLGKKPALIAAGRLGAHHGELLLHFTTRGVPVSITGEQSPEAISQLLLGSDFGIAPHPWALIGKSGAAAAMLEHGLPVVVPRDEWKLRDMHEQPPATHDPLLVRLEGLDADKTDRWLMSRRPPQAALPRIAENFLQALGSV